MREWPTLCDVVCDVVGEKRPLLAQLTQQRHQRHALRFRENCEGAVAEEPKEEADSQSGSK